MAIRAGERIQEVETCTQDNRPHIKITLLNADAQTREEYYEIHGAGDFRYIELQQANEDQYQEYRLIENPAQLSACMENGNCSRCIFLQKLNCRQLQFDRAVDFSRSIFAQKADFREATFSKVADFRDATFFGKADFTEATFSKEANFRKTIFTEWANFQEATFTENANFQEATFTKEPIFWKATFTKEANFSWATFSKETIFWKATFTEKADFTRATFTKEGNFWEATFSKEADFRGATFTERANFWEATFTEKAYFTEATFTEKANFQEATFIKNAHFYGTTFTKEVNFRKATFTKEANFIQATFTEKANFQEATFIKNAHFYGATFIKEADFQEACFKGRVDFELSQIKLLIFNKTKLFGKEESQINLKSAQIKSMDYASIDTQNIANRESAVVLKNIAIKQNDQITALKFYTWEMEKFQKELKEDTTQKRRMDRLIVGFEKWVSNFGTDPRRTFFWLLGSNIVFAIIYVLGSRTFNAFTSPAFWLQVLEELFSFVFIYFFYEEISRSTWLERAVFYAAFIINPILLYEIIKSFRKYSRKL